MRHNARKEKRGLDMRSRKLNVNGNKRVSGKNTNQAIRTGRSCYNFARREITERSESRQSVVDIDYNKLAEAFIKAEEIKQKHLENMAANESINIKQTQAEKQSLVDRTENGVSRFLRASKDIIFFKKENAANSNAILALLSFGTELMLTFIQGLVYLLVFVFVFTAAFSIIIAIDGQLVIPAIIYIIGALILAVVMFLIGKTFRIAKFEVNNMKNEDNIMSYFTTLTSIVGFIIATSPYLINVFPFSIIKLLLELIGGLL